LSRARKALLDLIQKFVAARLADVEQAYGQPVERSRGFRRGRLSGEVSAVDRASSS